MSVHIPGFQFSAVEAGIKYASRLDFAMIYSENPAVISGVSTTNAVKAAPILYNQKKLNANMGQAIVINSGCANACTGKTGLKDAEETALEAARVLGISENYVYVASTGVIGSYLPMDKIKGKMPELARALSPNGLEKTAQAIMTTDTFPKIYSTLAEIEGKTGAIAGIAKGAGMIDPNMATMLCFIVTDIAVQSRALNAALRRAVNSSFNIITVDGDMSTNDTALCMANGALDNTPLTMDSPGYPAFVNALTDVSYKLAAMVAKDGEGATKLIEVTVNGATDDQDADKAARAIARSNLVKTAIYGKDANWGRIACAIGYSGAQVNQDLIYIDINGIPVVRYGLATGNDATAGTTLSQAQVTITVDLGVGKGQAKILTCDLTEEYVKINADYRT
jgi:glutamate N-acetyltransferase/amino-acid N-acetyltransferase